MATVSRDITGRRGQVSGFATYEDGRTRGLDNRIATRLTDDGRCGDRGTGQIASMANAA